MRTTIQSRIQRKWDALPREVRQPGEVVALSIRDLFTDSGPQWAAAIAYYAMLSAFPLFLIAAAIGSYFVDPQWAVDHLTSALGDLLPQEDKVRDLVNNAISARGQVGLIAFAGFAWTGTRVFGTLTRAMNIAFDADESYSFLKRIVIEAIMLLSIGGVFVVAVSSGFVTSLLWDALQFLPSDQNILYNVITLLIQVALLVFAFFLIYRFVPRTNQDWRSAIAGAVSATVLFLIVSPLFQYYVSRFGNYNLVYGSLAIVVILLIWVWLVALITIFGGEIASHTKAMVIDGKSAEEVRRAHEDRDPTRKR